jgi:hypothetical protein
MVIGSIFFRRKTGTGLVLGAYYKEEHRPSNQSLMKIVKTKFSYHRKAKRGTHPVALIVQDGAECWELDHDRPDPDLQLFSLERSPKQENS